MDKRLAKDLASSVAEFYETHGKAFSDTRHQFWDVFETANDLLKDGDVLLDIGAGNGRLGDFIQKKISYAGFEPSSSLRGKHPLLKEGSLPRIPAPDNTADVTACLAVFHHIPVTEQAAAVDELVRLTKIGGRIIATAWHLTPDAYEPVEGGAAGDIWIEWRAEGAEAKRFVHIFSDKEWESLWTHPCLAIELIGFDKNKKNRLVVARKTC